MRTKRILALTLAILITLCSVPFTVSATSLYAEKSISAEEPMGTAIATAEELLKLMNTPTMWQGVYYLAADITLPAESAANLKPSEPDGEGEEATGPEQLYQRPIGTTTRFFTGVFDGNGKTISGLALEGSKYQEHLMKAKRRFSI